MYIQITNRCNMLCPHCCFSCTAKGTDMTMEIFRAALELVGDDYICIGGGEPTLHPKFWELICEAISYADDVWLATNGKRKKMALKLAKLAKKGVIGCRLSLDEYHDEIDEEVIDAFKDGIPEVWGAEQEYRKKTGDKRKATKPGNSIMRCGRARKWTQRDYPSVRMYKACPSSGDFLIHPKGNVRQCGCGNAKVIGTVLEYPNEWPDACCCNGKD